MQKWVENFAKEWVMPANANSVAKAQCEQILKVKLGELLVGCLALVDHQIPI